MTHSDSGHTGGCCCHRIVMQFDEIKNELQNVRQTVGIAVALLSKLVALAPDDIKALTGSHGGNTPPSVPDCLPVVSNGLRKDSTKEVMGISLGQTAVLQSFPENVKSRTDAERDIMKLDRVIVEAENDGGSIEDENMKSAIEVENDKSVGAKDSRTVLGAGNEKGFGQVKNNKLPVVSVTADSSVSVSEHFSVFLRASSLATPWSNANISNECSVVCGNMVTSKQQTVASELDVSVGAKWLEPNNKKMDSIVPGDILPGPCVPDMSPVHMLPAAAVCHVSASHDVHAETVEGNTEACVRGVRVKQEQSSEHDDDNNSNLSVNAVKVDERLQDSEEVNLDPEGMFIGDALQPVCILVKKEEGFYASNIQKNDDTTSFTSSHSMEQLSGQNLVVNAGDKNACSKDQTIGHVIQDSTYQVTSPLCPLLGSALVSKLKQKIQEKIQAAVCAVDEENRVIEGGSDNVMNTITCIGMSQPFNKDSSNVKELKVTPHKLRQKFYQCKSCAKIFFCKITLHLHKNHCRGLQKQYHCSSCPLMFKSRAVLFNHRQLHSAKKSKRRHKCEICGREFILKSTLKKHRQSQVCKGSRMKCYRKLPQHFCNQCGEGFLNSSNLELHQKIHKVGKTHSSNSVIEGMRSDSRNASVRVPRAVRRYPCSYCDEAFIDRRSVALHEKLHTDKEFATFDEERKMILRRHQLTMMFQRQQQQQQNNRKRFGCDVCGRCYSIELLLHMHTRLHHAIS